MSGQSVFAFWKEVPAPGGDYEVLTLLRARAAALLGSRAVIVEIEKTPFGMRGFVAIDHQTPARASANPEGEE